MSAGLDVEVDIWQQLDFNVELPCEHSRHETEHVPVDGGAAWVQFSVCPGCDDQTRVLVCDYWKRYRLEWQNEFYRCPACRLGYPGFLWSVEYSPISE